MLAAETSSCRNVLMIQRLAYQGDIVSCGAEISCRMPKLQKNRNHPDNLRGMSAWEDRANVFEPSHMADWVIPIPCTIRPLTDGF